MATDPPDLYQPPLFKKSVLELPTIEAVNLDTTCYRGSACLAHLATISQADIFDQVVNPDGLQRDLSPKHAAEAYDYLQHRDDGGHPRAFPEVVLNVRDKRAIKLESRRAASGLKPTMLIFDLDYIRGREEKGETVISRVDGNHRLFYAGGDAKRAPIMLDGPFQIHVGLTREQEMSLFVDINANQKGLNSSHLSILRSKLTPEELELVQHPARAFARRLVDDEGSPWHGLVHLGGSREGSKAEGVTRPVTFISLEQGVKRLLTKSQYIHDLGNPNAQYQVILRYWLAVREVYPEEWNDPREHLLMKNMGVLSMAILGATVIDRCMARGEVEFEDMVKLVEQTKGSIDWSRHSTGNGSVSGMSGNRAALIIAGTLAESLHESATSIAGDRIEKQLLEAKAT